MHIQSMEQFVSTKFFDSFQRLDSVFCFPNKWMCMFEHHCGNAARLHRPCVCILETNQLHQMLTNCITHSGDGNSSDRTATILTTNNKQQPPQNCGSNRMVVNVMWQWGSVFFVFLPSSTRLCVGSCNVTLECSCVAQLIGLFPDVSLRDCENAQEQNSKTADC